MFRFLMAVLVGSSLILISSCSDDDPTVIDEMSPTVSIDSPVSGSFVAAGGTVVPSINFTDDIEISSVTISISNGTQSVYNETISDISGVSSGFTSAITIPADVVLGDHEMSVSVEDRSGNMATAKVSLTAVPALSAGMVTVIVMEVPNEVTDYSGDDEIFVQGPFIGWDLGNSVALSTHTDSEGANSYYFQTDNTEGSQFKFIRGNDWSKDARNAAGGDPGLQEWAAGDQLNWAQKIETWLDYNPAVLNTSDGTVILIDGVPEQTSYTLTASISVAATTSSAISSVTYTVSDVSEAEVASGSMTVDGVDVTLYTASLDISNYGEGNYTVDVVAIDGNDATSNQTQLLSLASFPCDDSGLAVVSASMTRLVVNLPVTDWDVYATGSYATGDDNNWGGVDAGGTRQLTKITDGCYYLDVAVVLKGDNTAAMQIFKKNPAASDEGTCEWWKDTANKTETPGDGADATFSEGNSGETIKLVYGYWRDECS